ncbi:MAG: ABC transporter substrate-binding protein [Desulfobacteraceae bacterium]|nr:ABC transporter substrate-binding protein [Desulfobacteraceae bacterium]
MRCFGKIWLILIVIFIVSSAGGASASPARDQLKQSIDSILAVLKNPEFKSESQKEKRRDMLGKIVEERFDFEKMSQLSLARYWKERTQDEKSEFVALFGRLLKDTYITKMEGYTDEKVIFLKERRKKTKVQIDTKIITQTIEIPINYRMFTRENDQWMVYDVVIEGVSLIGNYRSQFGQILERDSFEELMDKLKKK